ncbi:urease accessory protein UreF [Iodidimonas sp. SYSU 1G8]|uniref:urease accessory protein UreF n=1 Tax=Iodidimonas sp. SYSU 1G8 TaxID=3133967 RepID=UPI0031FEFF34
MRASAATAMRTITITTTIMTMTTATIITATPIMTTDRLHLLRLQAWLSPSFPIGGFSYSHGLEQAAQWGWVHDRDTLIDWLETDLRHGAGRTDAILLAAAYRATLSLSVIPAHAGTQAGQGLALSAAQSRTNFLSEQPVPTEPCEELGPRVRGDDEGILEVAELAAALRGTAELALESTMQGISFLSTLRKAWPHPALDRLHRLLAESDIAPTFPVVVGAACAAHGVPLPLALQFTLHAIVANYVSASLRLMKMGQTDGQHAIAALEDAVMETAAEALAASLEDIGSASLSIDVASMRHETQYSRIFRS